MNLMTIEQLTAYLLLIVFLLGIALGMAGGAIVGSRRGALHWSAANDPLSLGAQVVHGVYVRDDSGYLRGLLPDDRQQGRETNQ